MPGSDGAAGTGIVLGVIFGVIAFGLLIALACKAASPGGARDVRRARPRGFIVVKVSTSPMSLRARMTGKETQALHLASAGSKMLNGGTTLCGKPWTRSLAGIFTPQDATCKECKRRWQIALR
jgi:hypothetical protein